LKPIDLIETLTEKSNKRKKSEKYSESNVDYNSNEKADKLDHDNNEIPIISLVNDEDITAFRNKMNIKIKGKDIPPPNPTFTSMNLHESIKSVLLSSIEKSSWKDPTPIQMQAIPVLLQNRNLLASAPTGSGKTGAFAIPLLSKISEMKEIADSSSQIQKKILGLVLAPSKELSEQISEEIQRLAAGKRIKVKVLRKIATGSVLQERNKYANVDILVSTPMRLLSAIQQQLIDLSGINVVILDEVDKLFEHDIRDNDNNNDNNIDNEEKKHQQEKENNHFDDSLNANVNANVEISTSLESSFLAQIDEILSFCPQDCQKGLFSATIHSRIIDLITGVLGETAMVSVGTANTGAATIDQKLVFVGREDGKLRALRQLVQVGLRPPVLIFLQSAQRAQELFRELLFDGLNVDFIHSGRTSTQREEAVHRFRAGDTWVLICTDLVARGMDFQDVETVINYDLPRSAVSYIHRIGRTGRAGKTGTFYNEMIKYE
jgi:ATP-dependent RNA helicase DDX52/ROK1